MPVFLIHDKPVYFRNFYNQKNELYKILGKMNDFFNLKPSSSVADKISRIKIIVEAIKQEYHNLFIVIIIYY